ncbi:MAG TPA: methyltransferase domain-containing protein [Burkholderiales bacterium]|nr:methyltransferase domain-containing protein [Burkholderiales bacterium]
METLQDWFRTPLGQYLLEKEQAYFDEAVADVFGFHAVQLGLPGVDLLRTNRIPLRLAAGPGAGVQLRADFAHLPLESNCIDLVVLPHVLEFSDQPHDILREVQRALLPEGQLIVSGFNPRSLWGARRLATRQRGEYPWCGSFISLSRLKDWLALLDLEVTGGQVGCYAPPLRQERWLQRFRFMEPAGDRWWPISGGVYFLKAVKRVHGMRVIKPDWNDRRAEALASVARPLNGTGTGRVEALAGGRGRPLRRVLDAPAAVLPFPKPRRRGPGTAPEGKGDQ